MKFLCMIFADEKAGAHLTDRDQIHLIDEMMNYNKELIVAGKYAGSEALLSNQETKTVTVRGSKISITDGPFIETKDQFTGYFMLNAVNMDEAIKLAAAIPAARYGNVEVRPVRDLSAPARDAAASRNPLRLEKPRFVDADSMLFVGIRGRFTAKNMDQMPQVWDKFIPFLGSVATRIGTTDYGLSIGTPMDEGGFDYLAAMQVSAFDGVPEELVQITVPVRRYVAFPHPHHVSRFGETFDAIYNQWFPKTDHKPIVAKSNLPSAIEVYGPDFNPARGEGGLEAWVPLKA